MGHPVRNSYQNSQLFGEDDEVQQLAGEEGDPGTHMTFFEKGAPQKMPPLKQSASGLLKLQPASSRGQLQAGAGGAGKAQRAPVIMSLQQLNSSGDRWAEMSATPSGLAVPPLAALTAREPALSTDGPAAGRGAAQAAMSTRELLQRQSSSP